MAAVTLKKLIRPLMVAGIAAVIVGCPMDLALKTTIKGLAAPPNVSSLKVTKGASNQFILRWVDPSDKDVDHIEIDFKTPLSSNQPPTPVTVATGVQTATVTVPFNNVQYILTVKSVDKAGNKSPGAIYSPMSFFTAVNSALGTPIPLLPTTSAPPKYKVTFTTYPPPGSDSAEADYTYGANGITTETDYYFPAAVKTEDYYTNYSYDGHGNLIRQEEFNYPGAVSAVVLRQYLRYQQQYDNSIVLFFRNYCTNPVSKYSTTPTEILLTTATTTAPWFCSTMCHTRTISTAGSSAARITDDTANVPYPITATWDPNTGYPSSLNVIYDPSEAPISA